MHLRWTSWPHWENLQVMCVMPAIYQPSNVLARPGRRQISISTQFSTGRAIRTSFSFCVPGQEVPFEALASHSLDTAASIYRGELPGGGSTVTSTGFWLPSPPVWGCLNSTGWARRGGPHPPGHPSILTPHRGVNQVPEGSPHVLATTVTHPFD